MGARVTKGGKTEEVSPPALPIWWFIAKTLLQKIAIFQRLEPRFNSGTKGLYIIKEYILYKSRKK